MADEDERANEEAKRRPRRLLGPENAAWRRRHARLFGGEYKPHPGAEPLGHEGDEHHLWKGSRGWKGAITFNLWMLALVAIIFAVTVGVLMLGGAL